MFVIILFVCLPILVDSLCDSGGWRQLLYGELEIYQGLFESKSGFGNS